MGTANARGMDASNGPATVCTAWTSDLSPAETGLDRNHAAMEDVAEAIEET